MHAIRNIAQCTKDCLCLYVCPTGATDTETGQIDASKCIGCGVCANACPSHAITMIPETYPPQQHKSYEVVKALRELAHSKAEQERIAFGIAASTEDLSKVQLAKAVAKSNRIMAEDLLREAGYMLSQSKQAGDFLREIAVANNISGQNDDFPIETVNRLMELLKHDK